MHLNYVYYIGVHVWTANYNNNDGSIVVFVTFLWEVESFSSIFMLIDSCIEEEGEKINGLFSLRLFSGRNLIYRQHLPSFISPIIQRFLTKTISLYNNLNIYLKIMIILPLQVLREH